MADTWGEVDFSQLVALRDRLVELEKKSDAFMKECTDELCARLLAKVKKRTPVWEKTKLLNHLKNIKGTKLKVKKTSEDSDFSEEAMQIYREHWAGHVGGFLRKSWQPVAARKIGSFFVAVLNNGAKYALYVEKGHRQQPGRFVPALGVRLKANWVPGYHMLRISEDELRREMDSILQRKQNEWLKKAMGGVMD